MASPPPGSDPAVPSLPEGDGDPAPDARLVRLERRERALRDWVAALVHDLRTPLQGVVGMTEVALDSELDVWQRSCLATALDNARSLTDIVDGLLDLLRLEDGGLELERAPFALDELLSRSVRTVLHRAHVEGLELDLELDPELPTAVLGDELRLRQCLVNLLGNAVKFTAAGKVTLVAERRGVSGVRLTVVDTGIGMTAEQLARVFEPYRQAEASTARRYGGSGLGLAVTRRLVELMGGRLGVESATGVGSRFHIDLELEPDPAPAPHVHLPLGGAVQRAALLVPRCHSRRVLERCLHGRARTVETYEHEHDLIAALTDDRGGPPDLLAVDERLLDLGGGRLAAALAATERRPFVLAVGHSSCSGRGVADFVDQTLPHPLVCGEVDRALEQLLTPRRRRSSAQVELAVLVADDAEISRRVLEAMFGRLGVACDLAADGGPALELARARLAAGRPYDLVLLDLQMSTTDGEQAARALRGLEREHGVPPCTLVALSGATDDQLARCLEHGFDDTLRKPVSIETLGALLDRLVERRRRPGAA